MNYPAKILITGGNGQVGQELLRALAPRLAFVCTMAANNETGVIQPVAEIGRKVGLSTTPCWRRIQKMEEDGVIRRRVALLDPVKVNTKVTVFVSIRTNSHSVEWLKRFSEVISEFPEVVEFYRMSGDVDYLMKIVVPDIAAYDRVYQRLIRSVDLSDVSSSFAIDEVLPPLDPSA